MADGLEISIDVTGDLSDLQNRLMQKAIQALEAGAKRLIDEHEEIIKDWNAEAKPEFITSPVNTLFGKLAYIDVFANGDIWHWVNRGTAPKTITGKLMKFPWEYPNRNYDSSYTPKISADWKSGSGEKHGMPYQTNTVTNRWIRPRNMDKKAIERAKNDVIAIMKTFFQ